MDIFGVDESREEMRVVRDQKMWGVCVQETSTSVDDWTLIISFVLFYNDSIYRFYSLPVITDIFVCSADYVWSPLTSKNKPTKSGSRKQLAQSTPVNYVRDQKWIVETGR